jgi:hypothetical protein
MTIDLQPRERDTILAALRFYQTGLDQRLVPGAILEIAKDNDESPLNDEEIDDLCERINI